MAIHNPRKSGEMGMNAVVVAIYLVVFALAVVGGSGGRCRSGAVHVVEIASR